MTKLVQYIEKFLRNFFLEFFLNDVSQKLDRGQGAFTRQTKLNSFFGEKQVALPRRVNLFYGYEWDIKENMNLDVRLNNL